MTHRLRSSRLTAVLAAVLIILGGLPPSLGAAKPVAPKPAPTAKAMILMDAETGEVLYEKSPDARRPIASTTKIMTAILVAEKVTLSKRIRVSPAAARVGESSMELVAGERRTIRELLYAMMLKSANDAAAALGIHIGKTLPRFATMMNRKAAQVGAHRTRFANPHGLTAPHSYSTARDLAIIASYGLRNPAFAKVVKTKQVKIPWPKHSYPRVFKNHNKLLWEFPGAIGVKTGYTNPAGHCLVGAARRGPTTLVAVVLGAPNSADALSLTAGLLRKGFAGYQSTELIERGRPYGELSFVDTYGRAVGLLANRDVMAECYDGDSGVVNVCVVSSEATLPISRGQTLGRVEARRGDAVLGSAPVVADRDLDAPTFWDRFGIVWSARLRELARTAERGTVAGE